MELPILKNIDLKEYIGPIPNSNWVFKGKLLVGGYPYNINAKKSYVKVLRKIGITNYVSLQTEAELSKLVSYQTDLEEETFHNFEIADRKIATDEDTLSYVQAIANLLDVDDTMLYMHCLGGHGRTGIIVTLLIAHYYELTAVNALRYTQTLHNARFLDQKEILHKELTKRISKKNAHYFSPQTTPQLNQVRRLITLV